MNVTEIRETLTSVSDAVPVPAPDPLAFRRRVTRVRRRRTAGRVAGAVAAVAVVASGAVVALGGDEPTHRTDPAPPSVVVEGGTPVLVEGRLRVLSDDGRLGPAGPAAARVVGTTPQGVVVLTDDGQLGRVVDGSLERLVPDAVRTAYLDGDAVVFENLDGLVRWWGIDPTVRSRASAQTEQGRLMAAAEGMAVIAQATGLMLHDAAGVHELFLDPEAGNTIRGVDAAEGVVAVRTDVGVSFFHDHGLVGSGLARGPHRRPRAGRARLRPPDAEPARGRAARPAHRERHAGRGPVRHRGRPRLVRPGRAARRGPGRRRAQPLALLGPGRVVHRAAGGRHRDAASPLTIRRGRTPRRCTPSARPAPSSCRSCRGRPPRRRTAGRRAPG